MAKKKNTIDHGLGCGSTVTIDKQNDKETVLTVTIKKGANVKYLFSQVADCLINQ